jgi:c-di-AMP phosphodiesterase-like protein
MLQPSMRLYFILLIVFAVCTLFFGKDNWPLAAAEIAVIALLLVYTRYSSRKRAEELLHYIEHVASDMDTAAKSTLTVTPLPVVVFSSVTGNILWSNRRFLEITGEREHIFEISINDVLPGFSAGWLIEGAERAPSPMEIRGRKYSMFGGTFNLGGEADSSDRFVITYFVDVTEFESVREEYGLSRPVFAIILLDNYDELLHGMVEKDKSALLSAIDDKISVWAGGRSGYLCKYDRDRYLHIFEWRHYDSVIRDKFSLLASARECAGTAGIRASVSIGVGFGGGSPEADYTFASEAVEMALSRGGDQAVVKNGQGFEFFGGRSAEVEKRTRVKTRVMANAFGRLLDDASSVYVMGHKNADMDALGAAVGVCCIARSRGKKARVIIDLDRNMAGMIVSLIRESESIGDIFVNARDTSIERDAESLLVVVDTSRPEEAERGDLIPAFGRVVVIDHHRRAATYIEGAALNFYEPYASSASELVTELIQHLVEQRDVHKQEAEALLAGIVLDTKSFSIRTGSRTFDAAAFLRRIGADTVSVKRLMQSDFAAAMARYEIVRGARMYRGAIAIAASQGAVDRVVIAQAADELLNIAGVQTSFVASQNEGGVFISGRGIGGVNVQLVLEKLGGGGNQSTAGAQMRDVSLEGAVSLLKDAIDKYISEAESESGKEP